MKRVMLLALLALALPTAALAGTIHFTSGIFQNGRISGSITNGGSFDLSVVGSDSKTPFFSYDIRDLTGDTPCSTFLHCFGFRTGTVTVKNPAGAVVFTGSLFPNRDSLVPTALGKWVLSAFASGERLPLTGVSFTFTGNKLTSGSASLSVSTAPDSAPRTLGLFGTGVIGLAELMRRKLKLGT